MKSFCTKSKNFREIMLKKNTLKCVFKNVNINTESNTFKLYIMCINILGHYKK